MTSTTSIPADELQAMTPYRGGPVLEYGNKKNSTGTYRSWYEAHGCKSYTCIDWNGKDGALDIDCNEPFFLSPCIWSMVTNFGFSEHVSNQPMFWKNHHDNTPITGIMCGVSPKPGYWPNHGILQPTEQFYRDLARVNGYNEVAVWTNRQRKRHTVCYRFIKTYNREFVMPDNWENLTILPTPEPSIQARRSSSGK